MRNSDRYHYTPVHLLSLVILHHWVKNFTSDCQVLQAHEDDGSGREFACAECRLSTTTQPIQQSLQNIGRRQLVYIVGPFRPAHISLDHGAGDRSR
jgi:hypothetical protein